MSGRGLRIAVVVIAVPIAMLLLAWSWVVFREYRAFDAVAPRIDQILVEASPEDRQPPSRVADWIRHLHAPSSDSLTIELARVMVTDKQYRSRPRVQDAVMRFLPARLDVPRESQGRTHLRNALWAWFLHRRYGDDDLAGLYATLVWDGADHGLGRIARSVTGKPLADLTDEDAATVFAWLHAPSIYAKPENRARFEQRRDRLLALRAETR